MTINDSYLYESIENQIKWWKERIEEEEKESTLSEPAKSRHISWMEGKVDTFQSVLEEMKWTRDYEVKKIQKEIKEYEDHKQIQSA